jgi:hypothetical protein
MSRSALLNCVICSPWSRCSRLLSIEMSAGLATPLRQAAAAAQGCWRCRQGGTADCPSALRLGPCQLVQDEAKGPTWPPTPTARPQCLPCRGPWLQPRPVPCPPGSAAPGRPCCTPARQQRQPGLRSGSQASAAAARPQQLGWLQGCDCTSQGQCARRLGAPGAAAAAASWPAWRRWLQCLPHTPGT